MGLHRVRVFQMVAGFQTGLHQELYPGLLQVSPVLPDQRAAPLPDFFSAVEFRMVYLVLFSLA
jgi:hypothetical protein